MILEPSIGSSLNPGYNFVFPVHLNPIVQNAVYPVLQNQPNVKLIEPLDYPDFVNIMAKSHLIFTDIDKNLVFSPAKVLSAARVRENCFLAALIMA
jgi:hypothetical protein